MQKIERVADAKVEDLPVIGGRGMMVEEGRDGDWSQTYVGGRFYPRDPREGDFNIFDIVVSCSNTTRYGGHCKFYCVGEHSYHVSYMVPKEFALDGLFHDGTEEPYINDMTRPVKRALGKENEIFKLSKAIQAVGSKKFKLHWPIPEPVLYADTQICKLEKLALHPRSQEWDLPFPMPKGIVLKCWEPYKAAEMFLFRFCELTGVEYGPMLKQLLEYRMEDELNFRLHCGGE